MAARCSANSATASLIEDPREIRFRPCYVDVEALGADHFAGGVAELFTDDHDVASVTLHGNDAVAGAERLAGLADVGNCRRHVLVVVGVLVNRPRRVVGFTVPGW